MIYNEMWITCFTPDTIPLHTVFVARSLQCDESRRQKHATQFKVGVDEYSAQPCWMYNQQLTILSAMPLYYHNKNKQRQRQGEEEREDRDISEGTTRSRSLYRLPTLVYHTRYVSAKSHCESPESTGESISQSL